MRKSIVKRGLLAGALVVTSFVVASGTADARLDETGGGAIQAVVTTGQANYRVAYNPERDEYLGTYTDDGKVIAVRTDADGDPIGSPVVVAETGPPSATQLASLSFWKPNVAYDASSNQYLVTMLRGDGSLFDVANRGAVVTGQLVSDTGALVGGEVKLNQSIGSFYFCQPRFPDVAAHRDGGFVLSYSLLWATSSSSPTAQCEDLSASQSRPVVERLSSNLTSSGRVLPAISQQGFGETRVDSNLDTGQVMVGFAAFTTTGKAAILDASLATVAIVDVDGLPITRSYGGLYFVQPVADPATGDWFTVSGTRFFELTYTSVFSNTGSTLRASAVIGNSGAGDAAAAGDGTIVTVGWGGDVTHVARDGSALFQTDTFDALNGAALFGGLAANLDADDPKVVAFGRADSSATTVGFDLTAPAIRPLVPGRLMDTRTAADLTTVDGDFLGEDRRTAGSTTILEVAGRGGVPTDAAAAFLNITAVQPDAAGFMTVYPCDQDRPGSSNLNVQAGANTANAVLAKIAADGTVCIFTVPGSHLLVDVGGFVPSSSSLSPVVPARLLDTRQGPAAETTDDQFVGAGPNQAGTVTRVKVTERGTVPADATSVLLNVTAVGALTGGFATVYSCDDERPQASNLNTPPGVAVPNLVLTGVSNSGEVCIYTSTTANLLADVAGYGTADSGLFPVTPARLLETRQGADLTTTDGISQGLGTVGAGSVTTVTVSGRGGVPDNATGAFLNLTAIRPATGGFFTAYPCDETRPDASNLNFVANQVVANAVSVKLSAAGTVCLYSSTASEMVLDVTGYVVD